MNFTDIPNVGPASDAADEHSSVGKPTNKRVGGGGGGNVVRRIVSPGDPSALTARLVVTPTNPPRAN